MNDVTPTFSLDPYPQSVAENAGVGSAVVTIIAADTDAGTNGECRFRKFHFQRSRTMPFFVSLGMLYSILLPKNEMYARIIVLGTRH